MGSPANAKINVDATVQRLLQHANKEQITRLVAVGRGQFR